MRLFCGTSDSNSYCDYALVEVTPEQARKLIDTYKPLYEHVNNVDSTLYRLEFFDGTPTWANATNAAVYGVDFDNTEWYAAGEGVTAGHNDADRDPRTAASCMSVTNDGILWSASPKNSDGHFETPELSWEDLEKIAAGENPFKTIEVDPEPMEDDGPIDPDDDDEDEDDGE